MSESGAGATIRWRSKAHSRSVGAICRLAVLSSLCAGLSVAPQVKAEASATPSSALPAARSVPLAGHSVDALRNADQALAEQPVSAEALRARVTAAEQLGAAHEALALAAQHPDLIDEEQMRRLEGSDAAQLVRFGPLDPASPSTRFAVTDEAIAALNEQIARQPEDDVAAHNARLRARLDRLVAWRQRVRMREVIGEYEALCAEHVTVPAYALVAVGDAYLFLHQADVAQKLYRRALELDPNNFETSVKLFYALIDARQFEVATRLIDSLNQQQPKWVWLKGYKTPIANPKREITEQVVAEARLYSDALPAAQQLFTALTDAAPLNPGYRIGLANTLAARGWPRRAGDEFEIAQSLDPTADNPRIAADTAVNQLGLQQYQRAATTISRLVRQFPESTDVRHAQRDLSLYQRPEVLLSVSRTYASASSIRQGDGVLAELSAYSAPIRYRWRLYGGASDRRETDTEGDITLRRATLGIEYRAPDFALKLNSTRNRYALVRAGADLEATWNLGDSWQLDGKGAFFAADTPLRALQHGVTANAGEVSLTYRRSELLRATLSAGLMNFSDGNRASGLKANLTHRVYTTPVLQVDGVMDVASTHNTLPHQAYYSPARDFEGLLGVSITQVLCRRYERFINNSLTLQAGTYFEQGYGSHPDGRIGDKLTYHASNAVALDLGLAYSRTTYDGLGQGGLSVTFNFGWRY